MLGVAERNGKLGCNARIIFGQRQVGNNTCSASCFGNCAKHARCYCRPGDAFGRRLRKRIVVGCTVVVVVVEVVVVVDDSGTVVVVVVEDSGTVVVVVVVVVVEPESLTCGVSVPAIFM